MFTGGWKEVDAVGLSGLGWGSDGFAEPCGGKRYLRGKRSPEKMNGSTQGNGV